MAKAINPLEVVVGLDVGRSGVKLAFQFSNELKTIFIPSVVIPAKAITYDTNPHQTKENTITLDGEDYFVGETAIQQGAQNTVGLTPNWLQGVEHRALLERSKKLLKSYGVQPKLIVAGLPVDTYNAFVQTLFEQVTATFSCNVLPVPQPWGVYQDRLLNDKGRHQITTAGQEKCAVIDIGHFTTDILLMNNNNWIQESSGSTVGMSKSCAELQTLLAAEGITITSIEAQEIIKTRKVKEFGQFRDVGNLVDKVVRIANTQIIQYVENLIGTQARTIDHIIVAGGGATGVFEQLKKMWPQTKLIDNPRFSVAIGMRKFGINQGLADPSNLDKLEK